MGRTSPRICCIKGCDNTVHARSMCATHINRLKNFGDPLREDVRTTWRMKVSWLEDHAGYSGDGCLTWPFDQGRTKGYGDSFYAFGKTTNPHRYMCGLVNGPPPTKRHVAAHSCGRGRLGCVDPRHLRWATYRENFEDALAHGTVPMGEAHKNSKLKLGDVLEIRALRGVITQREVAKRFGVSVAHVCNLQKGARWGQEKMPDDPTYLSKKLTGKTGYPRL